MGAVLRCPGMAPVGFRLSVVTVGQFTNRQRNASSVLKIIVELHRADTDCGEGGWDCLVVCPAVFGGREAEPTALGHALRRIDARAPETAPGASPARIGISPLPCFRPLASCQSDVLDGLALDLMTDAGDTPHDSTHSPAWYRDRWAELQTTLSTDDPSQVVDRVRALQQGVPEPMQDSHRALQILQQRLGTNTPAATVNVVVGLIDEVRALRSLKQTFDDAGFQSPRQALEVLERMETELDRTSGERKERTADDMDAGSPAEAAPSESEASSARRAREEKLKDALGVSDPDEIVTMVQDLARQLEDLYATRERFAQADLEDADHALLMIENMEEQLVDLYRDREAPPDASTADPEGVVAPEVLAQLDGLSASELDALDAGAFRVDNSGRVQSANEAALQWPGLDAATSEAVLGTNFFFDLAPGTNNPLFRGRFDEAVETGEIDVCFPYTYVSPEAPLTPLIVHLYRSAADHPTWILFRPLDTEPAAAGASLENGASSPAS